MNGNAGVAGWVVAMIVLGWGIAWVYYIWASWINVWRQHTRGGRHHARPDGEVWIVVGGVLAAGHIVIWMWS